MEIATLPPLAPDRQKLFEEALALTGDFYTGVRDRKMKGVLIITGSYQELKNTLFVINENYPRHPVTILTAAQTQDYLKALRALNQKYFKDTLNIVTLDLFVSRRSSARGIMRLFYLLPDIIAERRHWERVYREHLSRLEGYEVYFFSLSHIALKLTEKMLGRNIIKYISCFNTNAEPRRVSPFKGCAYFGKWAVAKLTYGKYISLAESIPNAPYPYITPAFVAKMQRQPTWMEVY